MAKKGIRRSVRTEIKEGEHISRGTEFPKGHIPWNKGKHTLTAAHQEKMRLARIGKPRLAQRRRIKKACARCGNEFETGGRVGKRDRVYCSRRCAKMTRNGRTQRPDGYILIMQSDGRRKLEHRIIAERMLGRKLIKGEVVHHINGVRNDNREENLLVMTQASHMKLINYLADLWAKEHPDMIDEITRTYKLTIAAGG